jgi:predicted DNA-binding transcriptional regulator AlpA
MQEFASTHDRLLDTHQSAEIIGCTPAWLEQLRSKGGGPEFIKLGRIVRYKSSALEQWFARRTVNSVAQGRGLSLENERRVAAGPKVIGRKRGRPRKPFPEIEPKAG